MEKLICDCKNEVGEPVSENHIQYKFNHEYVIECAVCGRFLKLSEEQEGVARKAVVFKNNGEKIITDL